MFTIAIIIGLYGYSIFFLGLFSLLYKSLILFAFLLFLLIIAYSHSGKIGFNKILFKVFVMLNLFQHLKASEILKRVQDDKRNFMLYLIIFLLFAFTIINLIGVLGPELAFDALWYHLTLPKLYLQTHALHYIPGGLYYYSVMPQLTEMLYTAALSIGNEVLAKCIHFLFGILACIALYKVSRKFLDTTFSLLVVLVFYSNLVVAWESITAYRDLATTFYQIMGVWGLLNYFENKQYKWLIISGCMLGFAIATNLLAITSIPLFILLVITRSYMYRTVVITKTQQRHSGKIRSNLIQNLKQHTSYVFIFLLSTLLIPLPWFIYSYINTGNPIYPFFTSLYSVPLNLNFHPILFTKEIIKLLLFAPDPLNPIYLICLPLVFQSINRLKSTLKLLTIYCVIALIIWYMLPRTGGGRYILPYLPVFSLVTVTAINITKERFLKNLFIGLILLISSTNLVYRALANAKYLPVILGKESKSQFLCKNLNFNFGDFYDCDERLKNILQPNKKILIFGGHNFYYADFNFVHSSYARRNVVYDYVLTQNSELSIQYKKMKIIYENKSTKVKLYKSQ